VTGQGEGWRPSRPSAAVVWERPTTSPAPGARAAAPGSEEARLAEQDAPGRRPAPPPRAASGRRWWRRLSPGRRLGAGYVALAVVTALVAGSLAPGQPVYGGLPPWQGTSTVDLREAPTASGWTADLAGALAPGAPALCLRFPALPVGDDGLVLVRAAPAWTYGFANDAGCGSDTRSVGSRVGLLDTRDGRLAWVHDVRDDFADLDELDGAEVGAASVVDGRDGPDRVLLRASGGALSRLLALDPATGRVVDRSAPWTTTDSDQFQAEERVVLTGRQPSAGGPYRYEVRDARDLGHVAWRGAGTTTGVVLALPDRALVATPDGTVAVDPRTGRTRDWGTRLDALVGPVLHDDLVVASSGRSGGFTAVDLDGRTRWSTDPGLQGAVSAARSCLVVTDVADDRVSCVDWSTGDTRWTRDRQGAVSVDGLAGQTDDAVFAAAPTDGDGDGDGDGALTLRALDGDDGAATAVAELPGGAVPAATGRTVGYAFAYGSSGGRSTVVAFDRSSGERLWVYQGRLQVSFWAGVLVDVDVDGVAHELTGPAAPSVTRPGS
jgi:hypothetical protein